MTGRPSGALRIIVLGYVIRGPLGGMVWHHLQYLQGLAELGHEVYFLEDSDDYPSCYDPERGFTDIDPTYGLRFASCVFERIGFKERWAYHDAHQQRWHGPRGDEMVSLCAEADLMINLAKRHILVHDILGKDVDDLFNVVRIPCGDPAFRSPCFLRSSLAILLHLCKRRQRKND